MSTKIIGLDSLKHIKSYIDKVRGSIREELDADTKAYLEEGIKDASEAIYKDYDSKYKELTDAIANAEANGGKGLEALKLQLDELVNNTNDKFVALDSLKTDLNKLNGEYNNLDIKYNSIFSPGQLDEVIRTALIDGTAITDDMVQSENMFATKMVALIANMGHINAGSIDAGTMRGSSIESTNTIVTAPNPNKVEAGEPVWKIANAGNGWFARGNIHWDEDGNVTFGPGVSLTWESISNADRIMEGIFEGYDKGVREYVQNFVKESTEGAASKKELENLKKEADKAVEDLKITVGNNQQAAEDAFKAIEDWKKGEYKENQQDLKDYADSVNEALKEAYITGDEGLIAQLEALKKEIEWEMGKQYEEFKKETEALSDLKNDFKDLQNSALTKYNMNDLLSASLVAKTEWNDYQISTPSVLAKKIVGLTATFGHINASKIVGTNIQGYTISSPTGMKDETGEIIYTEAFEKELGPDGEPVQATDEFGTKLWEKDPETGEPLVDENGNYIPVWQYASELGPDGTPIPIRVPKELTKEEVAWQLNADGSGHVAERQILWDYPRKENGEIDYPEDKTSDDQKRYWRREHVKVELGEGVQITWVTDALNKIGSKLADWAADGKMSPIEQKELLDLYNEYTEEYYRLCDQYDNYVTLTCPFPENLKSDFDGAHDNLTFTVKHHTRGIYDWNSNTPLKDIVNEDGSITEVISTIDIDKEDDGSTVANTKKLENIKNFVAARETFADGVAKAYSDWISEKTTKEHLGDWAKDGVLSPIEQKSLREEYLQSVEEKNTLLKLCEELEDEKDVEVVYEDTFIEAFRKFKEACMHHTSGIWDWTKDIALEEDKIQTIDIEKTDDDKKYANITTYYAVKSQFINALNTTLTDTISTEFEIGLKQAMNAWAADGVLSPIEQKELKAVYDNIRAEYNKLCEQYDIYVEAGAVVSGADKKDFDDAFTAFKNAVKKYTAGILTWSGDNYTPKDDDNITTVDVEDDYSDIQDYYTAKQAFITIMNRALGEANVSAADALRKQAMDAWAADGVLSPVEQKDLKKTYEELIKEKAQISLDIEAITDPDDGLTADKNTFNTAYSNMVKAVKYHTKGVYSWSNDTATPLDETSNVSILTEGEERYELIPLYYEAKQKVLTSLNNAIAAKASAAAEIAAAAYTDKAKGLIDKDLADAKQKLVQAMKDGDLSELAAAEGEVSLAKNASDALDTLKIALYGNKDGDTSDPSVLESGDLYNLSLAACGAEAAKMLDSGDAAYDSVFAQNIVSLAGTFAEVKAEKIKGTEIKGKTMSSVYGGENEPTTPAWQLNQDGSGWVANKQIEWSSDGNTVTLGNNVKIAWGNVDGSSTVDQSISNAQTAASNAQTAASNAQTTANAAKTAADSKVDAEYVGSTITTSLSKFQIKSHNIIGNLIEGKTIESSTDVTLQDGTKYYTHGTPGDDGNYTYTEVTAKDGDNKKGPAWQIRENGEGYLAGGAIRFNSNGITGVNGNQLMDGGLGESTKLTDLIVANAQIGKLDVYELNTGLRPNGPGGEGNGRINIKENSISVYQEGSTDEIMQISGSTSIEMTSMINVNHNFGMSGSTVTNGSVSDVKCIEIARNFLISDQFNYTLNDVNVTLSSFSVETNSASLYFGIIFSKTTLTSNSNITWTTLSTGITSQSKTAKLQCYINRNGTLSQIDPASLPNDTYYVYAASYLTGGNISSTDNTFGANVNDIKISIGPNINKTIISSKGLFCGMGKFKYLSMTENGFEVSFGTNNGQGLRVSADGIQKRVVSANSSWDDL